MHVTQRLPGSVLGERTLMKYLSIARAPPLLLLPLLSWERSRSRHCQPRRPHCASSCGYITTPPPPPSPPPPPPLPPPPPSPLPPFKASPQASHKRFKIPATSPKGGLSSGLNRVHRSTRSQTSAPHDASFRTRFLPALIALMSGLLKPVFWLRGTSERNRQGAARHPPVLNQRSGGGTGHRPQRYRRCHRRVLPALSLSFSLSLSISLFGCQNSPNPPVAPFLR